MPITMIFRDKIILNTLENIAILGIFVHMVSKEETCFCQLYFF